MNRTRPPETQPEDAIVELCAFRVGDEEYVLDIQRIREIVPPLPVTAVPRAPAWMEGVVDLRGDVLPLVDVRKRLGLPPRSSTRSKVLIVNVAGRLIGLLVDAVSDVVRIPRSSIGPPPALMPSSSGARLYLGVIGAGASPVRSRPLRGLSRPAAGRRASGTPPRSDQPERLRLLLNVKALLDPGATFTPPAPGGGPR